jgi:hypothetical protein
MEILPPNQFLTSALLILAIPHLAPDPVLSFIFDFAVPWQFQDTPV